MRSWGMEGSGGTAFCVRSDGEHLWEVELAAPCNELPGPGSVLSYQHIISENIKIRCCGIFLYAVER